MHPGWELDPTGFGILDSRAVEVVGDRVSVSDGYDSRTSTDPMNHAIFVIDVGPRLVTVHWSAADETRLRELVGFYGARWVLNDEGAHQLGFVFLSYFAARSGPEESESRVRVASEMRLPCRYLG